MTTETFTPSPKYKLKQRLGFVLIALVVLLAATLIAILVSLEEGLRVGLILLAVVLVLDLAWWILAVLLVGPYYKSLSYELQDDQIVMHVGIWQKSVKHVPFRTVTNITVKQGLLDRLLGLGTLDIQTAGMSGQQGGAEQSLVGLENAQAVYEKVAAELRRYRGAMAPTAAEEEGKAADAQLDEILVELRAIRQAMIK
jgi:uncharacterized membrane protein YdbT with pleckstrin-like domain